MTIVRRVQPPSQPPPAGERRRTPSPQRGEGWGGGQSLCPRRRGAGGTPALPGHGHRGGVRHAHDRLTVTMGKPGSPIPPPAGGSGRVKPARSGLGKPGFPILSPGGRVWECQALSGEPSYPIMGGSGRATPSQEQPFFIPLVWSRGLGKPGFPRPQLARGSGRATASQEQPYVPHTSARRSRTGNRGKSTQG